MKWGNFFSFPLYYHCLHDGISIYQPILYLSAKISLTEKFTDYLKAQASLKFNVSYLKNFASNLLKSSCVTHKKKRIDETITMMYLIFSYVN